MISSLWQKNIFPGGVNSPVRAFQAVGGEPLIIDSAHDCYLIDSSKRQYIDYVLSWGAMLLGHSNTQTIEAVKKQLEQGISFGALTKQEIFLAQKIARCMPSIEMLRLTSSGTEATMSAVRLARAITNRPIIVKFTGCYHGHSDALLADAGSGALTFANSGSNGILKDIAKNTLCLPFNDTSLLESAFAEHGKDIATVIFEPVAGNMGCILPKEGFLQTIENLCQQYDSISICDEIMTGFRVGLGGAQQLFGLKPDITTLGKIAGGGFPLAGFGGKRSIMSHLSPSGNVYHAGTLSGHPCATAAAISTLEQLKPSLYKDMEARVTRLLSGMQETADKQGVAFSTTQAGAMFGLFFLPQPPTNLDEMKQTDTKLYAKFFHAMLSEGIYFAPSAFEASFISTKHSDQVIETTIKAAHKSFRTMHL